MLYLLQSEFINARQYDDPDNPTYYGTLYDVRHRNFTTATLTVEESVEADAYDDFQNADPPTSYSRPTTEEFFNDCDGTTYRGYYHNGAGSITVEAEENSPACNYTPPVSPANPDPTPAPGTCQDPEADTYGSTSHNGVCQFSPKLTLDAVPDLVALGRPVLVTLHSAPIVWATPAPARCRISLASLQPGAELVLNGYSFTAGPATEPQRFADAETLMDAVRSVPALAAAYTAAQTDAAEVTLTARRHGRRYNVVATANGLAVTLTSGQDTYYSERRAEWGLWLEIWAVPAAPFGSASKPAPQLAARLESRYREDNAYQFDIAEPLRQFTGLSYDASDRLIGYFLRYGETYAEAAGGFRRNRQVGESALLFGLEAVEIMPPAVVVTPLPGTGPAPSTGFPYVLPASFDPATGSGSGGSTSTAPGFRRLSRRPAPVLLAGQLTTLLNPVYAGQVQIDAEHRTAVGVTTSEIDLALIGAGGLTTLRAAWLAAPADVERTKVLLNGALTFTVCPVAAGSRVLSFANGQGGMESVAFAPVAEPQAKRTTQLVMTTTGRRTYAAELADARRLTTGPLSRDVYEWLLAELGNSAAVWLETEGEPLPVNVTDFDAQADYVAGEFSLTVEIEPQHQPARGLTN